MRKYNRLKERYFETDFIDDEDSKVFANGVPKDFPNDVPEGAYFAFLDCFYTLIFFNEIFRSK